MKLVILPLDSRPCTYNFPIQIAKGAGIDVSAPPLELMDNYRNPSNFIEISEWLLKACEGADALICAMEQLVYGGLLASRAMYISQIEALKRASFLRKLKKEYPALNIYLSSVIMRTTVSTLYKEDLIWWEKVGEYSKLYGRTDKEGKEKLKQLENEIPKRVLDTFLSARRRNHAVNKEAIVLLAEGVVREVCFLQEDSAPLGMHRSEQEKLKLLAKEHDVEKSISIHCGTDEYATAMVGRLAASQKKDESLSFYVEWLAGDRKFVAEYEDRAFEENLTSYLKTCNIKQVDSPNKAQAILAVYAPDDGQRDLAIAPKKAICTYSEEQLEAILNRLEELIDTGLPVGLLDIYFVNGAECCLLRLAAKKGLLSKLSAYAAWNTSSNSLGCILGQLLAYSSPKANYLLHQFTKERLLDDWVYQAIVRSKLISYLKEKEIDVWDIQDVDDANTKLKHLMESTPETKLVCRDMLSAQLRWPRTFEVEIFIQEECS